MRVTQVTQQPRLLGEPMSFGEGLSSAYGSPYDLFVKKKSLFIYIAVYKDGHLFFYKFSKDGPPAMAKALMLQGAFTVENIYDIMTIISIWQKNRPNETQLVIRCIKKASEGGDKDFKFKFDWE